MELRDVSFNNQRRQILQSLNIAFQPGLIGLMGDNGQGKTTLLQIISGLLKPSHGDVLIDNQDIYQYSTLKRSISYLPAYSFLYPHLKLLENFEFMMQVQQFSQDRLSHLLQQFFTEKEWQHYKNILYSKLSDGLKKRAMLVAALLPEVRYYFFDEPCVSLSMAWRQSCWRYLAHLGKSQCVIVSSHHPHELIPYCNQVYMLEDQTLNSITTAAQPC